MIVLWWIGFAIFIIGLVLLIIEGAQTEKSITSKRLYTALIVSYVGSLVMQISSLIMKIGEGIQPSSLKGEGLMPKCTHCKKELDKTTAYLVEGVTKSGNKSRKWYCSKEEYDAIIHDGEMKGKVYSNILQYFPSLKLVASLPKILFVEVGVIASQHSWDKIYDYMQENVSYIEKALDKDFPSDASKGKYLAAVIRTGCEKEQRVVVREPVKKQTEEFTMSEPVVQPKKKTPQRRGFDDLLEEL